MQQGGRALLPAMRTPPVMLVRPAPAASLIQHPSISHTHVSARYMSERRRGELLLDNLTEDEAQGGPAPTYPTVPNAAPAQQQQHNAYSSPAYTAYGQTAQSQQSVKPNPESAEDRPSQTATDGLHMPASMPQSSSDGWGTTEVSSGSSDDGGWGEAPVHNQDWGDYAPDHNHPHAQPQQYADTSAFNYQEPMPTPTDGRHTTQPSSSWDAGPAAGDQYTAGATAWSEPGYRGQGPQPQHGYRHQHPHLNDNVAADGTSAEPAYEWQFFADGVRPGMDFDGAEGGPPRPSQPSDVTLLSRTEMDAVLPMTPTGRQADYFRPQNLSERIVQLVGSLAASMLLSKSTVLAAPALLYPLWSPWIRAALKNVEVYGNQLKTLGLWRAQVLEVQVLNNNTFRPGWSGGFGRSQRSPYMSGGAVVRLLMGDPWEGGARVQMEFPYQPKAELLCPGESVEALVLAKDTAFVAFKVIREVYAPGLGLWLTEYPFVDRTAFLDVSLQIERARQSEMEAAWQPNDPSQTFVVDVDVAEPAQSWDFAPPETDGPNPMYSSAAGYGANLANTLEDINSAAQGVAGTAWNSLSQARAAAAAGLESGIQTGWSSNAVMHTAVETAGDLVQRGMSQMNGHPSWGSNGAEHAGLAAAGDSSQGVSQVDQAAPVQSQGMPYINGTVAAQVSKSSGWWPSANDAPTNTTLQGNMATSQQNSNVPSGWDMEDQANGGGRGGGRGTGRGNCHGEGPGRVQSGWSTAAAAGSAR